MTYDRIEATNKILTELDAAWQSGYDAARASAEKEICLFDIEPTTARVTLPYVKNKLLAAVRAMTPETRP